MIRIFPWNIKSTSALTATPPTSSSSPSSVAQSVANQPQESYGGTPPIGTSPSANISNWVTVGLMALGLVLGGIVSYFGTLMSVKDMINQNTTNIGIHGQRLDMIGDTVERLESDSAKVQRLETDLALLCQKLQMASVCSRR